MKKAILFIAMYTTACGLSPKSRNGKNTSAVKTTSDSNFKLSLVATATSDFNPANARLWLIQSINQSTALVSGSSGDSFNFDKQDLKLKSRPKPVHPDSSTDLFLTEANYLWSLTTTEVAKSNSAIDTSQSVFIESISGTAAIFEESCKSSAIAAISQDYVVTSKKDLICIASVNGSKIELRQITIPSDLKSPFVAGISSDSILWFWSNQTLKTISLLDLKSWKSIGLAISGAKTETITAMDLPLSSDGRSLTDQGVVLAVGTHGLFSGKVGTINTSPQQITFAMVEEVSKKSCLPCHRGSKSQGTNALGLEVEGDWLAMKDEILLRVDAKNQNKSPSELGGKQVMPPPASRETYPVSDLERALIVNYVSK